jgi:hypothetical protein
MFEGMNPLHLFPIVNLTAMIVGLFAASFTHKAPSRGWIGVLLLLLAILAWILIEADAKSLSSLPMSVLFEFTSPVAVVYTFRSRRHAPDKLAALAAFAGSFIIGALFLFVSAGIVMWTFEIWAHRI